MTSFVFAEANGAPLHASNLTAGHFKPVLVAAGLGTLDEKKRPKSEIRLYDLRHTCATLLLAAGENLKVVSERLGHARVTLTLDTHSHVLPTMQRAAADRFDALLYGAKNGTA